MFRLLEAILKLWLKRVKYKINDTLTSHHDISFTFSNFKALLIKHLALLSQSLKMASRKPKHVAAVFSKICLYNKVVSDYNLLTLLLIASCKKELNVPVSLTVTQFVRIQRVVPHSKHTVSPL
jgi:hypothetical protein